jgi:4-amino-4-deoxy-L-arabinose transferase-like glycosyltransferase
MATAGAGSLNARGYRFLALALVVAVTVPRLVQRGMFLDGMVYASLARNLAAGQGQFWEPSFSATVFPQFHEHPPLGFAIQAVAFAIGGDHVAVERVYSLVMLVLAALLIAATWRLFFPARYDWLPVCLWVLPSVVTWAAINNMLENTQVVFTSAAVYVLLRAIRMASARAAGGWAALAGLLVVAAVLTKGPVGLFPIAVPVLCLLLPAFARPPRIALVLAVVLAVLAASAMALYAAEAPRQALTEYLQQQVGPSFAHRPAAWVSVVAIARHLAGGIIGRLAVVVAVLWLVRRRAATGPGSPRTALFLLCIGLAASAPLALSPKISGQYMVPSVPFFALAAAAFALPSVESFSRAVAGVWSRRVPVLIAVALLVATVVVPAVHGTLEPRDRETIKSMDAIAGVVPRGAVLGSCQSVRDQWGLFAYLQRFHRLSLEMDDRPVGGWFLQPLTVACTAPPGCRRVADGPTLVLYRCE